jgi:hypothetical protein
MTVLIPAALFAIYLLIFGHNCTKAAVVGLAGLYIVILNVHPEFPINTIANLAWDASTTSLLVLVPMLLLAFRYWQKSKAPNPPLNRTRAENARAG